MKIIAVCALLLALAGCGYHTAGHSVRIPAEVQTLAVPMFQNTTLTYGIEQRLTAATVRELTSRTNYRLAYRDDPNAADAILHGTVITTTIVPATFDSTTGRISSALVTVNVKVSLIDRKGKVLYENPNYQFREQYQVSREVSSFFQEETPAMERLSRDFARTLVADILEAY